MGVWAYPQLGEQLRDAMTSETPSFASGASTPPRMAPTLAYGRHRGPARDTSRVAAVVIALFWQDDQWMVPLTMRPTSLQHHGGQICLPGGQIDPGESTVQAALREYEEELGLRPNVRVHCGELPTQYVFGSDNLVHPVVLTIQTPSEPWVPDPNEVAEVIELPLQSWLQATPITVSKSKSVCQNECEMDTLRSKAPAIQYQKHLIWGATALILDELAQLLQSLEP